MGNEKLNPYSLIQFFAKQIIVRIETNCIRQFQKRKINLKVPDSGLKNTMARFVFKFKQNIILIGMIMKTQ